MSPTTLKYSVALVAWGLALTGTLSIANWPGDWGHSVCGAWGCGPPLQALLACHTSWLVVLVPLAASAPYFLSVQWIRRAAFIGLSVSVGSALAFAANDYFNWYAHASEWQRAYYFHRVGFSILTTVEFPIYELAGLSAVMLLSSLPPIHTIHRAGKCVHGEPSDARPTETESKASITAAGRE